MKTMTIRNIPDDVAAGLANRARESGRSMNATALAALVEVFGDSPRKTRKYADFSEFVGTMSDAEYKRVAKEIEETFERVDEDENKPWLQASETGK